MANHVLGNEHGDKLFAVVNGEGQTDKIRQNGGASTPSLDDSAIAGGDGGGRFGHDVTIDKGSFFYAAGHAGLPYKRLTDSGQKTNLRLLGFSGFFLSALGIFLKKGPKAYGLFTAAPFDDKLI
jgi:hypothetical protein